VALCPLTEADEADYIAQAGASADFYRGLIKAPATPEAFRTYLARLRRQDARGYVVRATGTGALVGFVNLNEIKPEPYLRGLLGYGVFQGFARQGYLTHAVNLLVDHAFGDLGLHRLEADVQPHNQPSRRLVESAGFVCEGVSRAFIKIDDEWQDHERWALLATMPRPATLRTRRARLPEAGTPGTFPAGVRA
jgi:ribosomal-protein-alanine N-acetyltransferase